MYVSTTGAKFLSPHSGRSDGGKLYYTGRQCKRRNSAMKAKQERTHLITPPSGAWGASDKAVKVKIYESGTAYRFNMNEASPEKAGETIPILHRRNNPTRHHR